MGTTQGTTTTGTDVQHVVDAGTIELLNRDAQLIGNYVSALGKGEKTAGVLVSDMAAIAVAIVELHEAGTWSRTIDSETGALFTSAKAFYSSLNRNDRFPTLHRVLRSDLIGQLMDGETLVGIGTNELAALIGCDPAQVTRTVKAKAIEAKAEATEAELEQVRGDAHEAALKAGATEAEAIHAGEAARAEAKRQAEAETSEAETEAETEAKAKAEAKASDRAGATFVKSIQGVRDHYHLMTAERQAEVLKEATALVAELTEFHNLQSATKRRGRKSA